MPFTYTESLDGVFDTFDIHDPNGNHVASLYYWGSRNGEEEKAKASAQLICEHLNQWQVAEEPNETVAPNHVA